MSRFRSWIAAMERPGNAGSRWLLAGAAIVIVVVIATIALITARLDGGLLRVAGGAPQVTLDVIRDPTPIALGDYLLEHRGRSGRLFVPPRNAGHSGQIVTFTVTDLEPGAAGRCRLHWSQLDSDRGRPATESFWRYEHVLGWPDGLLPEPDVKTTAVTGELWIPLPNPYVDVGWYDIQVRALCADREVAAANTGEFRVDPPSPVRRAVGTPLPLPAKS
jgi:hypothetical protein